MNKVEWMPTNQDEILSAARDVLLEQDCEQVELDDICEKSGAPISQVQALFSSKSDVLSGVLCYISDLIWDDISQFVDDHTMNSVERLNAIFGTSAYWKLQHREEMTRLYTALARTRDLTLEMELRTRNMKVLFRMLQQVVTDGVNAGEMSTLFPDEAAHAVIAIASGMSERFIALLEDPGYDHARECMGKIEQVLEGSHDAIERVLGVDSGSVQVFSLDDAMCWFDQLHA